MKEIISNLENYLKIYVSASYDDITSWDEKDIRNAESWAVYCEKISSVLLKKPFATSLERRLQKYLKDVSTDASYSTPILPMLMHATHSLHERLLANPWITGKITFHIITYQSEQGTDTCDAIGKACSAQLLNETVSSLFSTCRGDVDKSVNDTALTLVIVKRIESICNSGLASKDISESCLRGAEVRGAVVRLLTELTSLNHGFDVLLRVTSQLLQECDGSPDSCLEYEIIFSWLVQDCRRDTLIRFLANNSRVSNLVFLCEKSRDFFHLVVSVLFEPIQWHHKMQNSSAGSIPSHMEVLSLTVITKHLQSLCNIQELSRFIQKEVVNRCLDEPENLLWCRMLKVISS